MSRLNDFLTEAGVFYLATTDGNQPKVRPLGAHIEDDGKVIFGIGDFKACGLIWTAGLFFFCIFLNRLNKLHKREYNNALINM